MDTQLTKTQVRLDKVRTFKFNMRAMELIENNIGTSWANVNIQTLTMSQWGTIMYAGLLHEDPEMDKVKFMELVDKYDAFGKVLIAVGVAIDEFWGSYFASQKGKYRR